MYIPKHFSEPNIEVMHELIRSFPLSTVVTLSSTGLNANHIPLHLSTESAPFGVLRGHVARSNPIWNDFVAEVEVLAIFQGPDAYITPSWYPTKIETGKSVPTWNYACVHAYGTLRIVNDSSWLKSHLEALTAHNESSFPEPWKISDAPPEYIEKMLGAVVGIEIEISRISGQWKTSQNQPQQNQAGVICGLQASSDSDAQQMAALVAKHSALSQVNPRNPMILNDGED
jgi:transcriptional regulator